MNHRSFDQVDVRSAGYSCASAEGIVSYIKKAEDHVDIEGWPAHPSPDADASTHSRRPGMNCRITAPVIDAKDAGAALGIPYSALYELTNRGDIEYTKIGSRKYIQRESLMNLIATNTRRGYYGG